MADKRICWFYPWHDQYSAVQAFGKDPGATMKNQDRIELELLQNRQQRLREDLDVLSARIQALERRLGKGADSLVAAHSLALPFEAPPIIQAKTLMNAVAPLQARNISAACSPTPPAPSGPEAGSQSEPPDASVQGGPVFSQSLEMRLGTYWFVRVGVVLLLTALAFLAHYAYQSFIFTMAASGKVAFMYAASGLLLGAGAWLQRRAGLDRLRNYAQVLFGAGLAAVYFTTYAAHHIRNLRIIDSPVLVGALLLAWAAFIAWLADRKKSELTALFALGLAYYTSAITRAGAFTLYSNLVLSVAGVYFLWRNRWAALTSVSLAATYIGYATWRFYAPAGWRLPDTNEGLLFSAAFVGAYWIVFSAAVFLSKKEKFRGGRRALFLSFNNGAALGLFLLTMVQLGTGGFWKVCVGFGSVLLALAYLARVHLPDDSIVKSSYLTQGLVFVTAGLIGRFSGMSLALLLCAESVIIYALGCRIGSMVLRVGGWICALLAAGWTIEGLDVTRVSTAYMGGGVAAGMLVNAMRADKRKDRNPQSLDFEVCCFTALLLLTFGGVAWTHAERAHLGPVLGVSAVVLTLSFYLLRIHEIVIFSQGLLMLGYLAWLGNVVARAGAMWDNPMQPGALLASSSLLMHWWQRQRVLNTGKSTRFVFEAICAGGTVGVLVSWVLPNMYAAGAREHFPAVLTVIVLALTGYAALTRAGTLALVSQVLLLPSLLLFLESLSGRSAPWQSGLVVPVTVCLLAGGTALWLRRQTGIDDAAQAAVRNAATVYGWAGLTLLVLLVARHVPAKDCPWSIAVLAAVPFVWAGFRKGELLPHSLALIICATAAYVATMRDVVWSHLPNLAFIIILLGMQRAARRLSEHYMLPEAVHRAMVITGGLCLWLFASRFVQENATGFLLTVAWSVLALVLFTLGMVLRERPYRWLGLAVLGCSLARVAFLDVWKLQTIYRILSFMALGVVLLLLGYFYNRHQEKIREWL